MTTITGEYWIIDGQTSYADGDVGDTNHSGYALDHLRRKVAEALGEECAEMPDWDAFVREIPKLLNVALDLGLSGFVKSPHVEDVYDELCKFKNQLGLDQEDIDYAFERGGGKGGGDVRNYMALKYGWITCHGNRLSVWHLTRDALEQIVDAIYDLMEGEDDGDVSLTIFVCSTCKCYATTLKKLEAADYSDMDLTEIDMPVGPNAQVAKMDLVLEPEFYKQYPRL